MKQFILSLLCTFLCHADGTIDCVIFSYHRPIQLYATLESFNAHLKKQPEITVLYKSTKEKYDIGYAIVKKAFPHVNFIKESPNGFRTNLLDHLESNSKPFLIFCTDDIILTAPIDLEKDTSILNNETYGVYYRLGKNITYSGVNNQNILLKTPTLTKHKYKTFLWSFYRQKSHWGYPFNVDFTLFKKSDILPTLKTLKYSDPTSLESHYQRKTMAIKRNYQGVCFNHSRIINIVSNRVAEQSQNKFLGKQSAEYLNALFIQGKKINISKFNYYRNNRTHIFVMYDFINR